MFSNRFKEEKFTFCIPLLNNSFIFHLCFIQKYSLPRNPGDTHPLKYLRKYSAPAVNLEQCYCIFKYIRFLLANLYVKANS